MRTRPRSLLTLALLLPLASALGAAQVPAPAPATPPPSPQAPAPAPAGGAKAAGMEKAEAPLPPEAIEQLVAPIALYADDLISQILMASTYPLEVVEAQRWVKKNAKLKGDALAKELEKQDWDPSVKSLVAAPQVLEMMDAKLDWMQGLGDAFLAQPKEVMDAVQRLRQKAKDEGNLKTTAEQEVKSEGDTIIVVSSNPEVIYVPTYDPTVVYGYWAYPAYPPYYYYPPGYYGGYAFASFAVGVAWGYAWGSCNWGGGDVDIDINRNTNINGSIDRGKYKDQAAARGGTRDGKGSFQHDPSHRKGVGYKDSATAKKYDRGKSPSASTREGYRGRSSSGDKAGTAGASARDTSRGTGATDRSGSGTRSSKSTSSSKKKSGSSSAMSGAKSGKETRAQSQRGQSSRSTSRPSGGSRSSGGGRSGGGGRGGGGRRG